MKTFNDAQDAIEHSKQFDTIAACKDTPENREYLNTECDGHMQSSRDNYAGGEIIDYWSEDDSDYSGMAWRVYLLVEPEQH